MKLSKLATVALSVSVALPLKANANEIKAEGTVYRTAVIAVIKKSDNDYYKDQVLCKVYARRSKIIINSSPKTNNQIKTLVGNMQLSRSKCSNTIFLRKVLYHQNGNIITIKLI